MTVNLLDIPVELLYQVLACLDYRSLASCKLVCKRLRQLINESSALQYILELAITGNVDGQHSSLPVAEKLSALRSHQRAWDKLKWNRELQWPMAGGNIWELFGNVLAQKDREGWLMFRQLPSRYRGIEDKEWRVKPDFRTRDLGMDPSQDLLVLVEAPRCPDRSYRFHIKTLSSCTKHPLYVGDGPDDPGVIVHRQRFPDPHLSYTVQISGHHLGVLFNSVEMGENEIIIWDWRNGAMKLHLTGDEIRSFSFLSERHVALAVISVFVHQEELGISLLVVDFEAEPSQKKRYDESARSYSLMLPRLSSSTLPVSFSIRCDPSPVWAPNPDLRVPFHLAPSNRIHIVSLFFQTDEDSEDGDEDEENAHVVVLFAPQSTLLAHADAQEDTHRTIDWEVWGPTGTRLMKFPHAQMHSTVWECYSYGSRYVVWECSSRTNDMYTMLLYDFGRRARSREEATDHNCDLSALRSLPPDETFHVDAPTEITKIFDQKVTTYMPYRVHLVSLPATNSRSSLMCSEDALIVVDSSENERQYRILTF
ncbi:hypothetical protein PQX77_008240 [Marasmius sp. AFHP31]|nr:hypothetical protein PQX77_008299 [Marasmius sp. AFHP31]KAK1228746.1 hypothetical protein PQX77_008240 [Marasmius sp. AFHP31]